jgi:hypothetical protein
MLSSYIGAWLSGESRFFDPRLCAGTSGTGYCSGLYSLTWAPALLVLVVLTGGLTVAAFAVFRRRDLV